MIMNKLTLNEPAIRQMPTKASNVFLFIRNFLSLLYVAVKFVFKDNS